MTDELTIGRSPECNVQIETDTFASGVHARVTAREGNGWIEDLGSTNGTYVNGERIAGVIALQRGDEIRVGSSVLRVTN